MNYKPAVLFDLTEKTALFSGGGGILGQQQALGLAAAGATVYITSRTTEKAERVAAELSTEELDIRGIALDVTSMESIQACVASLQADHNVTAIDILINGAGGNDGSVTVTPDGDISSITPEAFDESFSLNTKGTFFLTQQCLPLLLKSESARVINVGSMAGGERPLSRVPIYALGKAAVHNLTAWLAAEFSSKYEGRILVNAIAPGFVLTEQNWELLVKEPKGHPGPYTYTARGEAIIRQTPMDRFGTADELVGMTQYLASKASGFVTGQVYAVDGGFSVFAV